jgi:4-hydroxybenzoate polyprenyltransferase
MKTIAALWLSLRPKQWVKNLFIFAGILFSQNLGDTAMLTAVIGGFAVFCLLSGAVYILNDLADRERDRKHPVKSRRPIASGAVSIPTATAVMFLAFAASLIAAYHLGLPFFVTAVAYLLLQVAYTFWLKHQVILDVFAIAAGFVLRVVAGAEVISVDISSWLIICTTLLSLFLGLGKRRHEIESMDEEAASGHRKVLEKYSTYLLDQMIGVVTASTVVCYALYTMADETVERVGSADLVYTVPFVLYAIFRYLYLIHKKGEGGNPETILTSDKPLLASIFLWAATAGIIIYR